MAGTLTRIHLVAHTHWDREWYSSFEIYRTRLFDLMDTLLDILSREPRYASFQLDGQTSMVEDYLEVRPERRVEIQRHLAEGKLVAGPWYTQPDEFLASGESLIRNLMKGIRYVRAFGKPMPIGHLPDSFGHISQLPQILRGFGISWAFAGRGVKLEDGENRRFTWQAPDGSSVLAVSFGYGNGLRQSEMPANAQAEADHIRTLIAEWKAAGNTGPFLMFHGTDHIHPKDGLPLLIQETNGIFKDAQIVHSTLSAYFEEASREGTRRIITGELRDRRMGLLEGTLSTRMDVKTANASAEMLLERVAEPLAAMAWLSGMRSPAPLLHQAWKYVLQNHAHDSICAAGVDEVSRDVLQRFRWAHEIGESVVQRSLKHLGSQADVPVCAGAEARLLVFNTLGFPRTGLVKATIAFEAGREAADLRIIDPRGNEVPHQLIGKSQRDLFVIRKHITPRVIRVLELTVAFIAEGVPALGSLPYRAVPVGAAGWVEPATAAASAGLAIRSPIAAMPNRLENERLSVAVELDGTLTVTVKETGQVFSGLHSFEDSGEAGDVYNHAPPLNDRIRTNRGQPSGIALVENGPARAVFEVTTSVPGVCSLLSRISLARGAGRIDIDTEVDNRAADHRLRALFPLGAGSAFSRADGQFDAKERPVKKAAELADCHPMELFVDVEGGDRGLAVLAAGMPEYEALGEDDTTICLTLLRSITKGPYNLPVPDAHMIGTCRFSYSLFPHAKGVAAWSLYRESLDRAVPLRAVQQADDAKPAPGTQPGRNSTSLFGVHPDPVVLSAVKQSEEGEALIVRVFNTADKSAEGKLVFVDRMPAQASLVDLNEENPLEVSISRDRTLAFPLRPKGIATLKLVY